MIIKLSDITESGLNVSTVKSPGWLTNFSDISKLNRENSEIAFDSDIFVTLEISKAIKNIYVNGDIKFRLTSSCARCLDDVRKDIQQKVSLILTLKKDSFVLETGGMDFYEGDTVDLSDYIREQIALSIPMRILCEVECKGLCNKCGINLKEGSCECANEWADTRFAVLKNIKV